MRSLRRIAFALVLATVTSATLLSLHPAAAAPGDRDRSFGTTGTVETPIGSQSAAYELALQPDGRIVVSGHSGSGAGALTLARYQPDGRLDVSFGSGGIVVTGSALPQRGLALQPDGKILVGASSGAQQMALARYRGDGSLDTGFGSGGLATGPAGGTRDLALQPDGKIVVVGTAGGAWAVQVARFSSEGALDTSFGTNGAAQTPIGYAAVASSVALQPDGKIVVGGYSTPGVPRPPPPPPPAPPPPPPPTPPPEGMIVARYHPDGSLDQSFGSGGVISVRIGRRSSVAELGLQPDGRILAVGSSDGRMALLRYSPEGLLDVGFGSSGVVLGPGRSAPAVLALQPDGKILVGGMQTLARYRQDGRSDPTFGSQGVVTTGFGSVGVINALAVQQDGRILAAGIDPARRPQHFTLSRFLASYPTTISARSRAIRFGRTTTIRGTLTPPRAGSVVKLLERDCYDYSTRVATRTTTDSRGRWSAHVRPGSRATIRAEVSGELSAPLAVKVRPKLTLEKVASNRFRARVVAAQSLAGSVAVVQQLSNGRWVGRRRVVLRRIARRGSRAVSGRTFLALNTAERRLRLFLPEAGKQACYASAASHPITG